MSITSYFRKALIAQMNQRVEFKDKLYIKATQEQIKGGILSVDDAGKLFEDSKKKTRESSEDEFIEVLIALKTIASDMNNTRKNSSSVDDLTSVFFLPAKLAKSGNLSPSEEKSPWFVREFLSPMVEPELSIGCESDVDAFLKNNIAEKQQIDTWEKNWSYVAKMYMYVTKTELCSNKIGSLENIETDNFCYVFNDTTVFASVNICKLYDNILALPETKNIPLYNKFISLSPVEARSLINNNVSVMRKHCGQIGGEYPLSASQRESLNHLEALKDGEILAVSGPPGTGKTTLLQSVVANLLTKHAIDEKDPPIIVASSTNNQAVTNIIDSFRQVNNKGIYNLEKRWISTANGFASYFPSPLKLNIAKMKNYQIGEELIVKINSQENIDESKECMLTECESYFSDDMVDVKNCKNKLHIELIKTENLKNELLEKFDEIMQKTDSKSVNKYIESVEENIKQIEDEIKLAQDRIAEKDSSIKKMRLRIEEWKEAYRKLSWHIRLFSFLPAFRKRIIHWTKTFKSNYEIKKFNAAAIPKEVLQLYNTKIANAESEIYGLRCKVIELKQKKESFISEIKSIENMFDQCVKIAEKLKEHRADLSFKSTATLFDKLYGCNLDDLNELLDTNVRYVEFWLAVHYYECLWIESVPLTEKQLKTNIDEVVKEKMNKLAMISPCMVMTFYMLPSKFKVWIFNERKETYLYDFIDLLIVDEAGQTSPEIAAPSFSLAKRAIVVGDEQQISPVWGTGRALDIALAIDSKVIEDEVSFKSLEESGLNVSQSSVMKVALNSCPYNKYDFGLFLCEHRRCYNEIIEYCNELVYGNKLQPCRGYGNSDKKRPIDNIKYPVIGYYNIPSTHSDKVGSSRINHVEAQKIVLWLKSHVEEIYNAYRHLPKKDVIAIITPFKEQANVIRRELKKTFGESSKFIDVGTVHTFQGGERRIIIFSTTYGSSDGCYFINHNKNLMNVAVSRAKDAFWVFGCIDCLKRNGSTSASGLLVKYIESHEVSC